MVFNNFMNIISKRSQGAVEFLVIFGAILFFFVLFFGIIQGNIADKNKEKERLIAQNVALDLKDEINIAAEASDGYSRNFSLPSNILGKSYDINITLGSVYLSMENYGVSYRASKVTGILIKGVNIIKKQNGQIFIN